MEPLSFAILLFSCADGGSSCQAVRADRVTYQDQAACVAAIDAVLEKNDTIDAPWIEAECRPVAKLPAKFRKAVAK